MEKKCLFLFLEMIKQNSWNNSLKLSADKISKLLLEIQAGFLVFMPIAAYYEQSPRKGSLNKYSHLEWLSRGHAHMGKAALSRYSCKALGNLKKWKLLLYRPLYSGNKEVVTIFILFYQDYMA